MRENGTYDKAIVCLKNILNNTPEDASITAILSHCYILNDDLEQAKIYLDKAKNLNPELALVGWNETKFLLKQNKVDDALVIAEKTNKLFPNDIEGMGVLGSCLRAKGNFEASLKYLNKAIQLNPNYAEAFINRGLISLTQEDKVTALSDLEKAHELKPHIKQIWDLLIGLIVETKITSKAISILIRMIEVDPNHQKSFSLLAGFTEKANDPVLAITSFEKILEYRPNDAVMHLNLGIAFQRQGDVEKAIEHSQKALTIKPDYAEAYSNLGNVLGAM